MPEKLSDEERAARAEHLTKVFQEQGEEAAKAEFHRMYPREEMEGQSNSADQSSPPEKLFLTAYPAPNLRDKTQSPALLEMVEMLRGLNQQPKEDPEKTH